MLSTTLKLKFVVHDTTFNDKSFVRLFARQAACSISQSIVQTLNRPHVTVNLTLRNWQIISRGTNGLQTFLFRLLAAECNRPSDLNKIFLLRLALHQRVFKIFRFEHAENVAKYSHPRLLFRTVSTCPHQNAQK